MTFEGRIRGTTRHGQTTVGVLQKASYEQPVETIHRAALNKTSDCLAGVSERLVMGSKPQIGTQMCEVICTEEEHQQRDTKGMNFDDFEFDAWDAPSFDEVKFDMPDEPPAAVVSSPRAAPYSPPPWAKACFT